MEQARPYMDDEDARQGLMDQVSAIAGREFRRLRALLLTSIMTGGIGFDYRREIDAAKLALLSKLPLELQEEFPRVLYAIRENVRKTAELDVLQGQELVL